MSSSFCAMAANGPSPGPISVSSTRKVAETRNSRPMVRASARRLAAGLKEIITRAPAPAIMGKVISMPSCSVREVARPQKITMMKARPRWAARVASMPPGS